MRYEIAHLRGNGGVIAGVSPTPGVHMRPPRPGAHVAPTPAVSGLSRTAAKKYAGQGAGQGVHGTVVCHRPSRCVK
ncbi:hypothetical protein ACLQ2R_00620 [Streptosporangium sp. DT93]|uniref:hypothetical protein n=1 Tax=Streptosporangium sp. DT93 TaxID=3393428 RepID=UPI003CFA0502